MIEPKEPSGSGPLVDWCKYVVRLLKSYRLLPGRGYRLKQSSFGYTLEFDSNPNPKPSNGFNPRGHWNAGPNPIYANGDVVWIDVEPDGFGQPMFRYFFIWIGGPGAGNVFPHILNPLVYDWEPSGGGNNNNSPWVPIGMYIALEWLVTIQAGVTSTSWPVQDGATVPVFPDGSGVKFWETPPDPQYPNPPGP